MTTRTSFYYDPIRQGYDTNAWRTLSGAPAIAAGGRLSVDNAAGQAGSAVHYGDLLKGEISFNVNVPTAPGSGNASRLFGIAALNTAAYIRFSIDDTFTCQTSDGTTTTESSEITWDSDWTGANTAFKIRWEGGTAKFFVNGVQIYAVSDASVPHGPLSLYLYDDSDSSMTIGDINAVGLLSFVMNLKTSDTSSYDGLVSMSQNVTVTENVSIYEVNYTPEFSESVTITESITMHVSSNEALNESVTVTDVPIISIGNYVPEVNDSVTVTENIATYFGGEITFSLFESVTVTEDPVVSI